jgi:hypothetical protein
VDLPPQGPAELLSHPAAAGAPRRSCGVRKGAVGGKTLPAAAAGARFLLLLIAFQGRGDFDTPAEPFSDFSSGLKCQLSLGGV